MTPAPDKLPDDVTALQAALAAERLARQEAEARATGAEAMVAHLKLLIAKLKHDRFGASSERGRKLIDQLELELGELIAAASEDAAKADETRAKDKASSGTGTPPRRQPARALLREEGFAPLLAFARLTRTDAWREGEEHWLERTSADLAAGGRLTSWREPMGVQPPERTLCRLEEFALSRDAASAEDALDEMLSRARFSGEPEAGEGE